MPVTKVLRELNTGIFVRHEWVNVRHWSGREVARWYLHDLNHSEEFSSVVDYHAGIVTKFIECSRIKCRRRAEHEILRTSLGHLNEAEDVRNINPVSRPGRDLELEPRTRREIRCEDALIVPDCWVKFRIRVLRCRS